MLKVKVQNMASPRTGRKVPNQFIITTDDGAYFQSYASIIAFVANDGVVTLDENCWDCSVTTGKYRNMFLGENKRETKRKIESGQYKLANLN